MAFAIVASLLLGAAADCESFSAPVYNDPTPQSPPGQHVAANRSAVSSLE
jgi:hypothetical protein